MKFKRFSGGLRSVATSGYCLSTLRVGTLGLCGDRLDKPCLSVDLRAARALANRKRKRRLVRLGDQYRLSVRGCEELLPQARLSKINDCFPGAVYRNAQAGRDEEQYCSSDRKNAAEFDKILQGVCCKRLSRRYCSQNPKPLQRFSTRNCGRTKS